MATPTVSEAFEMDYDDDVILAYQTQGAKLRGTVRVKPGIVGEKVRFQKIAAAEAEQKSRHGLVPVQELVHSYVDATIADWFAAFYSDYFDEKKLGIDERKALVTSGAWSIGRKIDSLLITQLDTTTSYTGDFTAAMSKAVALAAFEKLNDNKVPDNGERYAIVAPHAWSELLNIDQFSRADYVGEDKLPWTKGTEAKRWLNMIWMMHGDLPYVTSGAKRTCFMYHKFAAGLAQHEDVKTTINWIDERDSYLVKSKIGAAAALIDALGVVEMRVKDDIAVS